METGSPPESATRHRVATAAGGFDYSGYARGIAQVLQLKETDLPRYLQGTGLPVEVMYEDQSLHMDVDDFLTIITNCQQMVPDPTIGLRCGKHLQRSVHGPVSHLAMNAPDLYHALRTPAEFAPLRLPLVDTHLSFAGNWLICELQVQTNLPQRIRQIIVEAFALTIQATAEAYLGAGLGEVYFGFSFPPPAYADRYTDYFQTQIRFSQSVTALHLPAALGHQPNPERDPQAYAAAQQLCTQMLNELPERSLDIIDRVRRLLLTHAIGTMTEEDVAQDLFISKRTLARRLSRRGQSYRQIREQLLAELSARYLTEDQLSVEATASLLGYHDAANFRRAFKRWYKLTPTEFRDRLTASN